jgi:hypothetical protein
MEEEKEYTGSGQHPSKSKKQFKQYGYTADYFRSGHGLMSALQSIISVRSQQDTSHDALL